MKLGILGRNITYTLSPLLHEIISVEAGFNAPEYNRFDISPEELEKTIQWLVVRKYTGVNVTIPYKQTVLPFTCWQNEAARQCGATNTLWFAPEGITAWNTDLTGMIHLLQNLKLLTYRYCVIFGYGGVAPAVVYALKHAGIRDVFITGRNQEKIQSFCRQHPVNPLPLSYEFPEPVLWINATPAGSVNYPEIPQAFRVSPGKKDFFLDLNYAPCPTHFQDYFEKRGVRTTDGLGLLIEQAIDSQTIWRKNTAIRNCLKIANIRKALLQTMDKLS